MKKIKYIAIGVLALASFSLTSCNKWLDVNVDPENPTVNAAAYYTELAHCQFYVNSAKSFADWRTSMSMGDWTRNSGGGTYFNMSIWYPTDGICTNPYQWFFVGAGATIKDMYTKAMEAGHWHYAGVAKLLYAYGYMLMTDLYGEMPYTEGLAQTARPKYDNGKTIYLGCFEDIDSAIELLARPVSDPTLPSLSVGDFWNEGDVAKWKKLAYLLKARWINKLSKKSEGSYKEGKWDKAAILECLNNAMTSNADNTIINHTDDNGATHDVLGWDEPVDYSPLFSVCGMNGGYMPTKALVDNLTNFDGLGVEDPRADRIIPWAYSVKTSSSPAELKWDGNWRRSLGVDMQSDIHSKGGPLRASYGTNPEKDWSGDFFWIDHSDMERRGDTVYVECTSSSKGYSANVDIIYRRNKVKDNSKESGSFYTRVSSPTYVGTYAEACFIKAEVLFNGGDKSGAYAAYKEGVKASMELMNEKLKAWVAEDAKLGDCPSFKPIQQADMDNFLANGIGTASDITLGRILTQKRLALMFSIEIWNDMRRYDFDKNIFLNWDIPAYHLKNANATRAIPEGKFFRRWRQSSHETNYNTANVEEIGSQVPGAEVGFKKGSKTCWNLKEDVWTINVWWDSKQE